VNAFTVLTSRAPQPAVAAALAWRLPDTWWKLTVGVSGPPAPALDRAVPSLSLSLRPS